MKKAIIALGPTFAIAMLLSTMHAQSTNAPSSASTPGPEVRDVAANPSAHVGHLVLTGVIGIVTAEKGFVLVDMKEYQEEGFGCLATDEPTKISVQWKGAAFKVKDKVRVEGTLSKEKKGYAFTAEKVEKKMILTAPMEIRKLQADVGCSRWRFSSSPLAFMLFMRAHVARLPVEGWADTGIVDDGFFWSAALSGGAGLSDRLFLCAAAGFCRRMRCAATVSAVSGRRARREKWRLAALPCQDSSPVLAAASCWAGAAVRRCSAFI